MGVELQIMINSRGVIFLLAFMVVDKFLQSHAHYRIFVDFTGILIMNLRFVIFASFAISARVFVAPQLNCKYLEVLLEVKDCGILGKFKLCFKAKNLLIGQM